MLSLTVSQEDLHAVRLSKSEFEAVVRSRAFDQSFYLKTYPDIAKSGLNPLLHYLEHGRFEKRKASALFDPKAYVEVNPDVSSLGVEPFLHYVLYGRTANAPRSRAELICRQRGWDYDKAAEALGLPQERFEDFQISSERFDPAAYLEANPEIASFQLDPLLHYLLIGRKTNAPLSQAERICREYGLDFSTAAQTAGLTQSEFEAVLSSRAFDQSYYLKTYPDIAEAGLNPLLHYLGHGRFEKRKASALFDPKGYVDVNPDVSSSGVEPFLHYVLYGRTANAPRSRAELICRQRGWDYDKAAYALGLSQEEFDETQISSDGFDAAAYLAANPEIASLQLDPLLHYLLIGRTTNAPRSQAERICREYGLDFSSAAQKAGLTQSEFDAVVISRVFDESFYLNTYPDIAAAGLNPLLHYLEHGRFEKRRASALFDPNVYVEINPGVLSSGVEPFLHYVLIGRTANAPRSHAEWVFRTLGCRLNQDELSKLSAAELSDVLSHFSEFTDVIKPLLDEIEHVFSTFVLRKPGAAELVASIAKFYETKTTWEDRRKAIAEKDIRKHLGIRPLRLEMDIVNQCNLRCIMCHFSSSENFTKRKQEIGVADFARVAEQIFPLCSQVSLSISTEPLLHRNIEELLRIAGTYRIPFTFMYTNGILLRRSVIDTLIQQQVNQISISIDGATKQTYERIRVGASFDKLVGNIQSLNQAKRRLGSQLPYVSFNIVMMRSNIEELPALVRLAHSLEVKSIYACHMVPLRIAAVDPNECLQLDKDLCNRMMDEAREAANRYEVAVEFPRNFMTTDKFSHRKQIRSPQLTTVASHETSSADASCPFPWSFVGLEPGGRLIPCGWWYGQEPMGNILTESFEEIWNNEGYRKLRSEHLLRKGLRPVCETCPVAGTGDVNSAQAFVVK